MVRLTRRPPAAVPGALLLVLLAGCGAGASTASTPDEALPAQCGDVPEGARRAVVTAPDGTRLGAAVVGDAGAARAVVVVHGASQTACDWLGIAADLVRRADAVVLVPDRRGVGANAAVAADPAVQPADVAAAAAAVPGAPRTVAVVGSSAGGPVALSAAVLLADAGTPPCAVALVSPAAVPDVPFGALPGSLWTVVEGDGSGYLATTRQIVGQAPGPASRGRQVVVPGTTDHSSGLVEKHPEALDLLVEAVTSCG